MSDIAAQWWLRWCMHISILHCAERASYGGVQMERCTTFCCPSQAWDQTWWMLLMLSCKVINLYTRG